MVNEPKKKRCRITLYLFNPKTLQLTEWAERWPKEKYTKDEFVAMCKEFVEDHKMKGDSFCWKTTGWRLTPDDLPPLLPKPTPQPSSGKSIRYE